MQIPFNASPSTSLGVEVELGIVDRESRELTGAASDLLAELGDPHPDGEHPKAKHELFECTVEIITDVCSTVAEARADLQGTLDEVRIATDKRNLALMCSGTHPFSHWNAQKISPNERYYDLVERIQWPARRLAIHGIHYHVGVGSGEHAIAIANSLAFHLPVFLALSASSPYWHGLDTGMASCRTKIFEGLPTAGLPPQLASYEDFEAFMATLIAANAIETVREVWWDVRPHPRFGTVELRMCDGMSNFTEVCAVAALAQCLVHDLQARLQSGGRLLVARDWVLRENKWLAARYGLEADVITDNRATLRPLRDVVSDLLDELEPTGRELGCEAELRDVEEILRRGASYARQREVVAEGGTLVDVVDRLIDELDVGRPL